MQFHLSRFIGGILFLTLSGIVLEGCSVASDVKQMVEMEKAFSGHDELPENFPQELWIDVPTEYRSVEVQGGYLIIHADSTSEKSKLIEDYHKLLEGLEWTIKVEKDDEDGQYPGYMTWEKYGASLQIIIDSHDPYEKTTSIFFRYRDLHTLAEFKKEMDVFGKSEDAAGILMAKVLDRYASCKTYRDKMFRLSKDGKDWDETCRTSYKREGNFRFEIYQIEPMIGMELRDITKRDDEGIRTVSYGEEKQEDIIEFAIGHWGGTTYAVDLLLMGEKGTNLEYLRPDLLGLGRLHFEEDETIDGVSFKVIAGIGYLAQEYKVWINPESLLIKQIQHTMTMMGKTETSTVRYEAEIDVILTEEELALNPDGAIPGRETSRIPMKKLLGL